MQFSTSLKISVVVPTRNRTDLLPRSLRSVAMQSHPDVELIVVDDSTTDAVRDANLALVQAICPGALYLTMPAEMAGRGPGFSRNHGIARCGGTYVAFLDDDDEWIDPDHLARTGAAMQRHGFDVHVADQEAMHARGHLQEPPIWTEDWAALLPRAGLSAAADGSYRLSAAEALLSDGFAHLNTIVVGLGLLRDRLQGFDLGISYEEDRELYFRLLDQAEAIGYTPGVVARHHIPAGANRVSASNTVPDEEKEAARLRWFDGLIATARMAPVRERARRERVYTLKRIATRAVSEQRFGVARQRGMEALRASFGVKWLGYMMWVLARGVVSARTR